MHLDRMCSLHKVMCEEDLAERKIKQGAKDRLKLAKTELCTIFSHL